MATLTADFETGTNGNTLSSGDAGSATAFHNVNGTPTYSNAQAAQGTLSMLCAAAMALTRFQWYTAWGTRSTTYYGRLYLYHTVAYVGTGTVIIDWFGGTIGLQVKLKNDRKLDLIAINTVTSTTVLSLDTWYRVEWTVNPSTTVGFCELKIYAGDSATVLETLTTTVGNNGGEVTGAGYGNITGTDTGVIYLDAIADKADSQPGSLAPPAATAYQPGFKFGFVQ